MRVQLEEFRLYRRREYELDVTALDYLKIRSGFQFGLAKIYNNTECGKRCLHPGLGFRQSDPEKRASSTKSTLASIRG
jgi:hypothetical protein